MLLQQSRFHHQRTVWWRRGAAIFVQFASHLQVPRLGLQPGSLTHHIQCLHRGGEAEQSFITVTINPGVFALFFLVVDIAHWGLQLIPSDDHAEQEPLETEEQRAEPKAQWVFAVLPCQTVLAIRQLFTPLHYLDLVPPSCYLIRKPCCMAVGRTLTEPNNIQKRWTKTRRHWRLWKILAWSCCLSWPASSQE